MNGDRMSAEQPDMFSLHDVRYHAVTAHGAHDANSVMDEPQGFQHSLVSAFVGDQPSGPTGGARRDRTDDLMLAKHALSQLSYGPNELTLKAGMSRRRAEGASRECGAEPLRGMQAQGLQLKTWWAWEDLNLRPHAYQARALTN